MNMHFWRATLRSIKYRGAASTTDAAPNTPAPGTGSHAKARQALYRKTDEKSAPRGTWSAADPVTTRRRVALPGNREFSKNSDAAAIPKILGITRVRTTARGLTCAHCPPAAHVRPPGFAGAGRQGGPGPPDGA